MRVFDPKHAIAAVYVVPHFDEVTKDFVVGGKRYRSTYVQGTATEQGRYVCNDLPGGVILEDTMAGFRIQNGMELDLSDPGMRFMYDILMDSEFVAPSLKEFNPASRQRFYIYDEESVAKQNSLNADLTFDAMNIIRNKTVTEKRDFAAYSGEITANLSDERIDGWIKQLAMVDPKKIIDGFGHVDFASIVFIHKLLNARILTNSGGAIKNNDVILGTDIDQAVLFVKNPKNDALVEAWRSKLAQLPENLVVVPKRGLGRKKAAVQDGDGAGLKPPANNDDGLENLD